MIKMVNGLGFNSVFPAQNQHFYKQNVQPKIYFAQAATDTVSFKKKPLFEDKQRLFDNYEPRINDFGDYKLPVHNQKIADRLQKSYSLQEFEDLFNFADENGAFDIKVNPKNGFVQTSIIGENENPLMSKLVWVTDSCNFMPLLKDKHPELCVPLFENLSRYYDKQSPAFNRIIVNPLLFELNRDWAGTAKNGVGHVFNPENLISHKWFARTRLDSMGLYLQSAADLIIDGLNGKEYGYKSSKAVSDKTINSIANATAYLQAIIYPYAKDTGAWEEKTFNAATSSDVAIINEAYRKIIDLMYSKTDDKELSAIRKRLLNAKNGAVFADKEALQNMLSIGEYRILTNSEEEIPNERKFDGAMSFIFKTEKLDENPIKNAKKILKRLEKFEKNSKNEKAIVRENGILRYVNDKYLYLNQDIEDQKPEYNTQRKLPKHSEAQWFMVSDLSKSYGVVAKSLIDEMKNAPQNAKGKLFVQEAAKLLDYAIRKETEYINRSYARLTGENSYKANGEKCLAFKVPEAYQAVTDSKGKLKFVPGTHSPLTWAQVSLYEASKQLCENLKALQEL